MCQWQQTVQQLRVTGTRAVETGGGVKLMQIGGKKRGEEEQA